MTAPMIHQPFPGPVPPPADTAPATPAAPAAQLRGLVSPTAIALALASPAITLTMLALARHWSDHGARHSIGDMVPLTLGAIIGLALTAWASATQDTLLVGTCASLTAAALAVGMMAYPAGLSEPLIVTVVATVTGWVMARRVSRARSIRHEGHAEREKDRQHETGLATIAGQTAIGVATIQAQGAIEAARVTALGELAGADRRAEAIEFESWKAERDARRRQAMTLSATAREALAGPAANGVDAFAASYAQNPESR
jgi:hypothetical protein